MDKIVYSCENHIEELLEIFLDESEEMPIMNEVKDAKMACVKCKKMANYELLGSEVKTVWE